MDNKKFETLINLIINENEEQARELFHDIVVEKSREIYESLMDEENMEEGMGGQVGDLLDEINAEEEGVTEEDESDIEFDDDAEEEGDEMTHDMEMDHDEGEHEEHEEIEDAVIRIEDKLDQLMAEFEEIMAGGEGQEDMGDEEMSDMGDEEMSDMGDEDDMDESVMENVNLQKVSVTHGDNGQNTRSTNLSNSGQAGMDSKPVNFAGKDESVPTSPKKPSDYLTKGEGNLPGAGNFKNVPGKNNANLGKTPAPVKKDGATGTKSPVAK
jgi:hypothetical protein